MGTTLTSKDQVPEWAANLIREHKVCVFSKSYCPYCRKAIETLRSVNAQDMHIEQIENNPYMDDIQNYMQQMTGARSVPRVFIGGNCIGGGDDTAKAKADGTLVQKLKAAGAL